MTESTVFFQVLSVYLILSFIANQLIVKAKLKTTARLVSVGYFAATFAYIELIGTIHQLYKEKWIDEDYKQALIFLMATYALCLFIFLSNLFLSFNLRRSARMDKA